MFCVFLICFCACGGSGPAAEVLQEKPDVKPTVISLPIIAIQPFGDFDTTLVSFAAKEIRDFYQIEVKTLKSQTIPDMAWYSPRSRYRADSLLIWLEKEKSPNVNYILGLTNKDISCTKEQYADWGIFGLGYMPGPSCVVSTFRLKKNNATDDLFMERFAKVLLHEIGHNLGLDHCSTVACMMGDANGTINTVDQEEKQLCPSCKLKIGIKE